MEPGQISLITASTVFLKSETLMFRTPPKIVAISTQAENGKYHPILARESSELPVTEVRKSPRRTNRLMEYENNRVEAVGMARLSIGKTGLPRSKRENEIR